MAKLNNVQAIAKIVGVKSGKNTWFSPDIKDPDNQNVLLKPDTSIALGCVNITHLSGIVKERVRPHFPNTFTPPID